MTWLKEKKCHILEYKICSKACLRLFQIEPNDTQFLFLLLGEEGEQALYETISDMIEGLFVQKTEEIKLNFKIANFCSRRGNGLFWNTRLAWRLAFSDENVKLLVSFCVLRFIVGEEQTYIGVQDLMEGMFILRRRFHVVFLLFRWGNELLWNPRHDWR